MARRTKDEQRPIAVGDTARTISNDLIARHGILQAMAVADRIAEQVRAALESQKRLHPEDWTDESIQSAQSESEKQLNIQKIPPTVA